MRGAGGARAAETPAPSPGSESRPHRSPICLLLLPPSELPSHLQRTSLGLRLPEMFRACDQRTFFFFLLLTAEQTNVRSLSLLGFEPGELSEAAQGVGSHVLRGPLSPPAPQQASPFCPGIRSSPLVRRGLARPACPWRQCQLQEGRTVCRQTF